MNNKKHNWILYLITTTIVVTIAIQFYWNYNNFELNKQRIINEIQISLDNSIEYYYTDLSKQLFFTVVKTENGGDQKYKTLNPQDSIHLKVTSLSLDINDSDFKKTDSNFLDSIVNKVQTNFNEKPTKATSKKSKNVAKASHFYKNHKKKIHVRRSKKLSKVKILNSRKATDSLKLIEDIRSIFIAMHNDSINYKIIDSVFSKELKNKGITSYYYYKHFINDTLIFDNTTQQVNSFLETTAKSTYFKQNERFQLIYSHPTYEALKRSSTGILLSLLLAVAVISSLFYLLKVINNQKQLAEIKNDLISNITHEFKTPITTASTAIEAIANFNKSNNRERTQKYLSFSAIQLKKLHQMVEKLLETASLDSEQLILKKENTNIVDLIKKTVQKYQQITKLKNIAFTTNILKLNIQIDTFHFENAISNLIDNAIKYGGNEITVSIYLTLNKIEFSIIDNGKGIEKSQQEKIFEKFYRIPKGNTHNVKGFGIGLYYTKKIIAKHTGFITINSSSNQTIFKITLPNDQKNKPSIS